MRIRSICIFVLILVFVTTFSVNAAQPVDIVDSTFNPQIQTTTFQQKTVSYLEQLPDGKILVAGNFNSYNGVSVGSLIRLNQDASLDTTFNNNLLESGSFVKLLPDGKILLLGDFTLKDGTAYTGTIIQLNSDGTIDSSFNFSYTGYIYGVSVDANGRILLTGTLQVIENGGVVNKNIIRLNSNGTTDLSFKAPPIPNNANRIATQSNKILYVVDDAVAQQKRVHRLNEDGTNDTSFTSMLVGPYGVADIEVQSDNKILILSGKNILRLNENGDVDPNFQITTDFLSGSPDKILLHSDGRITIAYTGTNPTGRKIVIRLLQNGTTDPSFTQYSYSGNFIGHTILQDGSVLIGDQSPLTGASNSSNRFMRLLPSGLVDTSFNPGGSGFQNVSPGKIEAISVLADEKILIGGDFDRVNDIDRKRVARLNADSTLDTAFQINTAVTGNYFSRIADIYHFAVQNDGKIIVSGNFDYYVNGVQKRNVVRLNSDGSIDTSFLISIYIEDAFDFAGLGKHELRLTSDGKVLIGTTRRGLYDPATVPLLLTAGGSKDSSFNPTIFNTKFIVSIYDIAIQPNGKILIAGRYTIVGVNGDIERGFIARLNADGTTDQTFQAAELVDKVVFAFSILQNGQILIVSGNNLQTTVARLNSDGSLDSSFNTGTGANGRINAVSVLPNNKILVGGAFSTYNNQARQNLAMLNADGNLDASLGNINREVLCITLDNQGRVLIGGHFTAISGSAQSASISGEKQNASSADNEPQFVRSYLARLIVSSETVNRAVFDFDGDGKTDLSIFRPSVGEWWYEKSSNGGNSTVKFGSSSDKIVPADYTGDGKADIAFFRPSTSEWFIIRSENGSFYSFPFGATGDIAVPADYDGDGKSDPAVFRPSTQTWFILKSSGGVSIQTFGATGDVPVVADYDGDGKADLSIYRPSVGQWWLLRSSLGIVVYQFGNSSDKPVQGDYTGDGKADTAFFRPSTNEWFILRSENGSFYSFPFGAAGDVPSPGDYDGDGRLDAAVFRPSTNTWYAQRSTSGTLIQTFGQAGDQSVPNAFVP